MLPSGLTLVNGAQLKQSLTFDIIGMVSPFYCSVPQVQLAGGMWLRKLQPTTIAFKIYESSTEADLIVPHCLPDPDSDLYQRFINTRNQWVKALASRDLILDIASLIGSPGAHVLANLSVTRSQGSDQQNVAAKLKELNDSLKHYEINLRSGGRIAPGERVSPAGFGAKGVMDWTEKTPGRTWINTGYGANLQSIDFGSPTGGRGKPVKLYIQPFTSPPIVGSRSGCYQGGFPMNVIHPQIPFANY